MTHATSHILLNITWGHGWLPHTCIVIFCLRHSTIPSLPILSRHQRQHAGTGNDKPAADGSTGNNPVMAGGSGVLYLFGKAGLGSTQMYLVKYCQNMPWWLQNSLTNLWQSRSIRVTILFMWALANTKCTNLGIHCYSMIRFIIKVHTSYK